MKKMFTLAVVALVPALFFVNVWQSFRYSSLKREISRLEAVQQDLIEQNKRSIAGISVLEAPERIEGLAKNSLKLSRPGLKDFIIIQPRKKERETDG
jgi:cell division protein FtsB